MKALVLSSILFFLISFIDQKGRFRFPSQKEIVIEQTEMAAWRDLIDAAPDTFRENNGLRYREIGGGLAINFQKEPIPLFNRVIGLGLTEPLTQKLIDSIKAFYALKEKYLIHFSSPMQPDHVDSLLKQNGFYLAGSWERIVRDAEPMQFQQDSILIVKVDAHTKNTWVKFLIDTYGFSFYQWPEAFALRKNWKHYMALRQGKIVACRSFYYTSFKTVFSGVDAPVPGVMTPDHGPDFAIWQQAIADGLKEGVTMFVADIELPDRTKNKASYEGFEALGFSIPYTRYHYRLNK